MGLIKTRILAAMQKAAACEGEDETAVAQTGTEVRAVPFTTFKTSPHKVSSLNL